jgi:hypothetical protein
LSLSLGVCLYYKYGCPIQKSDHIKPTYPVIGCRVFTVDFSSKIRVPKHTNIICTFLQFCVIRLHLKQDLMGSKPHPLIRGQKATAEIECWRAFLTHHCGICYYPKGFPFLCGICMQIN